MNTGEQQTAPESNLSRPASVASHLRLADQGQLAARAPPDAQAALDEFPEVRSDHSAVLDLALEEFLQRLRRRRSCSTPRSSAQLPRAPGVVAQAGAGPDVPE